MGLLTKEVFLNAEGRAESDLSLGNRVDAPSIISQDKKF